MSTEQQIIDAIENLAEKKVGKEIHSKYNEMNRLNKQLQKDILNISQLLKVIPEPNNGVGCRKNQKIWVPGALF